MSCCSLPVFGTRVSSQQSFAAFIVPASGPRCHHVALKRNVLRLKEPVQKKSPILQNAGQGGVCSRSST